MAKIFRAIVYLIAALELVPHANHGRAQKRRRRDHPDLTDTTGQLNPRSMHGTKHGDAEDQTAIRHTKSWGTSNRGPR